MIAIGAVTALICARTVVRRRPASPAGIVLRAIDRQILWAGIAGGVTAIATWWTARVELPLLAWSWMDAGAPDVNEDTLRAYPWVLLVSLAVVILATYVVFPAAVLVHMAPVALAAVLWGTRDRMLRELLLGDGGLRPIQSAVIRAALFMLLGVPVIAAVGCAVMTVAAEAVFARRCRQRVAAESRSELETSSIPPTRMDPNSKAGEALSSWWDTMPRSDQGRCAQTAAFTMVLAATITFTPIVSLLSS